jgi:hypothetical protein
MPAYVKLLHQNGGPIKPLSIFTVTILDVLPPKGNLTITLLPMAAKTDACCQGSSVDGR